MIVERAVHSNATSKWSELEANVAWEFGRFAANLPRVSSSKLDLRSSKLDEVIRSFSSVLQGREIDTAQLLKACRAHLALLQSGGAALCLVAKDLESNLRKAEALYKKSPKEGKSLTSLLEIERKSGIHNGNLLRDPSAAMGLLWIRRSIAFQSDLYSSLILDNVKHPSDAAYDAYNKHLSPYHGWMLRTVFPATLSQMPEREVFIAKFAEIDLEELDVENDVKTVYKLRALVATWEPIINAWKDNFERVGLEDTRRV